MTPPHRVLIPSARSVCSNAAALMGSSAAVLPRTISPGMSGNLAPTLTWAYGLIRMFRLIRCDRLPSQKRSLSSNVGRPWWSALPRSFRESGYPDSSSPPICASWYLAVGAAVASGTQAECFYVVVDLPVDAGWGSTCHVCWRDAQRREF